MLILQTIIAVILVVMFMILTFTLIRTAANFYILLVGLLSSAWMGYSVYSGEFSSWLEIIPNGIVAGVIAGVLCAPVLPFSKFLKNK
ncbi:MAG: hypothetical protein U9O87_01305 [Verrucomicrobiota bacterium]|nr:hypothetical protein [Verrucomicrobiota bacterium]